MITNAASPALITQPFWSLAISFLGAIKLISLDPKNGLCLSSLHDRAFDQGLLTLNENFEIMLSSQLLKLNGKFARDSFDVFQGQTILQSNKLAPCAEALAYHRAEIFQP